MGLIAKRIILTECRDDNTWCRSGFHHCGDAALTNVVLGSSGKGANFPVARRNCGAALRKAARKNVNRLYKLLYLFGGCRMMHFRFSDASDLVRVAY
ncbi:hypothetical protein PsorP6_012159 [Peronosclerospora sorghi]|uniref:Uncharacterized protein n=1 Tax=Peronosclerospora sorghi TaxID=230839 RepID=A0ACC0WIN5_9STRA|nr:hypothetical protein PsorP6_012159 [Peronosclerospora sorghi]